MTIGIDASRANLERKTGVEFYSYFLIQELKKIISEPYKVILYSPEPLCGELANLPPNWEWRYVRSPIILPFRGKRPFLWTQFGLSLEMLRRPPDVLFVPSHALPFICPKNSYVTIHDIGFDRYPASYHWLARLYHRLVTRFAVWQAKKIITISEFTKKELIDVYRASPEKIVAIPNGYDLARFHTNLDEGKKQEVLRKYNLIPPPQSSPLERGRKEGDGYIFYVGRLEKKKNIATLIKALELLAPCLNPSPFEGGGQEGVNLNLVLVGSPAFGYDEIQKVIFESPVRDRIKILNYVSSEDLPYLMSSAAAFVFPSLYEGFGIPILEAMACGTPVVASDIPALREVLEVEPRCTLQESASGGDERRRLDLNNFEPEAPKALRPHSVDNSAAIFAHSTDPQDLAQKIHQVLTDQTLRQNMITHGLEHVKKFSWVTTARKVAQVLTE